MKSRKEVDFLIMYEIKNRELENACLLKYELEKRGYSVAIYNTWNIDRDLDANFNAKVLLLPWAYGDEHILYSLLLSPRTKKVVNLQYEQIFHSGSELDSSMDISGAAREIVHVSWGKNNYEKLTNVCKINADYVKVVGHITLDFLRKEFANYYFSKKDLLEKFGIPINKKVILFISSFSYIGITNEETGGADQDYFNTMNIISVNSQMEIIKWFKNILDKQKEYVVIYRPHPAESNNIELLNFEKENANFYIIKELSVKQWILACDQIYTWYSTSLAEIFVAKKLCYILRPVEIPSKYDIPIYAGAKFINNYADFEKSLAEDDDQFPINEEILKSHYDLDDKKASYKKIADLLEDILSNPKYSFKLSKIDFPIKYRIRALLKRCPDVYRMMYRFGRDVKYKIKKLKLNDQYFNQMKANNYASYEEIKEIEDRINKCLGEYNYE